MFAVLTPLQWLAFACVVLSWIAMMGVGISLFLRVMNRNAGGGYGRLLASYGAGDAPPGDFQVARRRTVQVGRVTLKRSATVGFGAAGLFLKAPLRHAVLVPWSDIKGIVPTTLFARPAVSLFVGQPPGTTLTLFPDDFDAMRMYLSYGSARDSSYDESLLAAIHS